MPPVLNLSVPPRLFKVRRTPLNLFVLGRVALGAVALCGLSGPALAQVQSQTPSASPFFANASATPMPGPSPSANAAPAATTRLEGVLLERGTKKPLSDVNVFVLPAKLKGTTDKDGRFVIEGVPEGEAQLIVNAAGYLRLEQKLRAQATSQPTSPSNTQTSEATSLKLYLERASYQGFETTVLDRAKKRDDSTKTLKAEQFMTMPGANGDPVKAVQNLPGVARAQGFSSQVIIQGAAPKDTNYQLDDHAVPIIFHFGGLTSVITPEAVEQVDYLSAGYGPEFGRAMGGIVGLKTRDPETERAKGFAFMDTSKAGFLLEGPLDQKSSYLVTARYSYISLVLAQVLKDNPTFDLTVAPAFMDLAGVYKTKLSERDELRVSAIGSHDELKFLFKEPVRAEPGVRGNFSSETTFYRVIPQWTHRYDDGLIGRYSVALGQDRTGFDLGDNYLKIESTGGTLRSEVEKPFTKEWTSYFGLDVEYAHYDASLKLPRAFSGGGVANPISSGDTVLVSMKGDATNAAPYWRNTYRAEGSKWTLMPSLRADYIYFTKEFKPAPRFAVRYEESDSLSYKAAAGMYYQPPEPQEISESYGNPDLKAPYAFHYTLGADKDFRGGSDRGFVVQSNLFYRQFENLVINSSRVIERNGELAYERYSNEGTGRSFGAEFLIRYDAKPWTAWLAYTISKSLRTEPGQDEHVFAYDQTHNINVVGSVDLESNWKLSSRARFVTGNPTTPITGGTFDADNDVYIPKRGAFYSERLEPFFQLDLRADKKWVYDTWILWAYLDIQNVTNQKNPEAVRYSYDYSQKSTVSGLPVFPTIGVRGEF